MPAPIATSLRTLLPLITAQLVTVTGVTSNRVLLLQRGDTPTFQGDSDILVRVGPPQPVEGYSSGAGRNAVILRRPLQVTPRVRLAVDQSDRDDYHMTDASGLVALEEAVVDALHIWVPRNSTSDWLTQEPIHWAPGAAPIHQTPVSQSWLHTDLVFDMLYQLSVTANTGF